MKNFALVVVLTLAITPALMAGSVIASKHDLRSSNLGPITGQTEVCVSCHTPHQPAGQATDPLWNHTLSGQGTYGVYGSTTLNAVPVDVGGGTSATNLCLSCHDGTIAVGSQYNPQNGVTLGYVAAGAGNVSGTGFITGNPLVGTDLTNDHPVNFTYNAALVTADAAGGPSGLNDPTGALVVALLRGGMVQCSSCHNPHDNQFGAFLVKSNVGSALCVTCHIK